MIIIYKHKYQFITPSQEIPEQLLLILQVFLKVKSEY